MLAAAILRSVASFRALCRRLRPRRLGVRVDERQDGLTVFPSPVTPASVHTYEDHRVAMALALIGLRAPGVEIQNPGCVSKTFPTYFSVLDSIRR